MNHIPSSSTKSKTRKHLLTNGPTKKQFRSAVAIQSAKAGLKILCVGSPLVLLANDKVLDKIWVKFNS